MCRFIFTLTPILCLCILLQGCSSFQQKKFTANQEPLPHKILFIKEHWHTSIVLEAPPLLAAMPELKSELEHQPYVRVGWGDGDFFSGKSKSNLSATRALFVSSYSAMQVLTYEEWPEQDFEEDRRAVLWVSDEGFNRLIDFVRESFLFNEDHSLQPLKSYHQNTGSFFVARERYSLFNNCNSWSGNALEAANLPIGFHLMPSGVLSAAKKIALQQSENKNNAKVNIH